MEITEQGFMLLLLLALIGLGTIVAFIGDGIRALWRVLRGD